MVESCPVFSLFKRSQNKRKKNIMLLGMQEGIDNPSEALQARFPYIFRSPHSLDGRPGPLSITAPGVLIIRLQMPKFSSNSRRLKRIAFAESDDGCISCHIFIRFQALVLVTILACSSKKSLTMPSAGSILYMQNSERGRNL